MSEINSVVEFLKIDYCHDPLRYCDKENERWMFWDKTGWRVNSRPRKRGGKMVELIHTPDESLAIQTLIKG